MTFKKYPDIERLGTEDTKELLIHGADTLIVEEKVDGGNGCFWLEDDVVHHGSRSRDLTEEKDEKAFAKQQIWLREHLAMFKLNPDYVYYIEWMAPHTILYTNSPDVIGLDIRMNHQANAEGFGMFLGRDIRVKEFERIGIENTPLVWRGTVEELKKMEIDKLIPKSKYYDGQAEGIVIKNYCRKHPRENHQLYAKVVTLEFKENNKAVFGGIKNKHSDTQKIIDEFVTVARIKKAIHKLVQEEGHKMEPHIMKYLSSYVIKDVLKEEFTSIYDKFKFIDFKELKSKVPKICYRVLTDMITEETKK